MKDLQTIKMELLADGIVDANEVKKLEKVLYADNKIDLEAANFLFELNDAVSGKPNHELWKSFFVKAITSYILEDEKTPGVISNDEALWLMKNIANDGKLDDVERALLLNLKEKAFIFPMKLNALL